MVTELIDKYLWLIRTLTEAGAEGIDLQEITRKWENRYGTPYPRRTFIHHKEAVAEIFGIEIECNRRTNRYFLRYGEDAMNRDDARDWLINTFTINSLLTLSKERLSGRVAVEDIPSGHRFLTEIMEAMQEDAELEILYQKYDSPQSDRRIVAPYAVKEYEKRWYLIGYRKDENRLRTYALDRIQALKPTGEHFRMPKNFDVDELFAHSFGIYLPGDDRPVLLKVKATEREARYLRDLPLHPTQQEKEGYIFQYYVIPNDNLYMELCKHGNRLEVLEPQQVREKVAEELQKAANQYQP